MRVFGEIGERTRGGEIHQHRGVPEFEVQIEQRDAIDRGRGERDGRVDGERRGSDAALAVDEEDDVAAALHDGVARSRAESPDQDLDLRREHRHLDGLGDVFVGPFCVAGEDVVGLFARGQHDHRDPRRAMVGAHPSGELQAVHVRHVHVRDHEVR